MDPWVNMQHSKLQPGTLWEKVHQTTYHALASGALQPIETQYDFLYQGEMRFLVRILANLNRKEVAKQAQDKSAADGKPFNPFLPYERALFVSDLTDTHLCLLNKYNVVDHHILIVTRAFEDQDTWLTLEDFVALGICMAEMDGLGFYNGGTRAGASQRHKHLQLVPLPLLPEGVPLPLDGVIAQEPLPGTPTTLAALPFSHRVLALPENWLQNPETAPAYLLNGYQNLMAAAGLDLTAPIPNKPYNLLVTRQWMMVVPRCQDSYRSIPVNSLGFAGSLLVKNADQMAILKELGPLTLLCQVADPQPVLNTATLC